MKKILLFSLLFVSGFALRAQDISFIKADQITRWKNIENDTVYVLNFWATWCAPCVAELPEFEKLNREYAGRKVKVVLVNNDFRRDVEKKLIPFVRRKKIRSEVVFMDETTPNSWIDLVSTEWTGSIPATLIVNKHRGVELFFEKQLNYETLEQAVRQALKTPNTKTPKH